MILFFHNTFDNTLIEPSPFFFLNIIMFIEYTERRVPGQYRKSRAMKYEGEKTYLFCLFRGNRCSCV